MFFYKKNQLNVLVTYIVFPKQTNFDSISNEQIQQVEDWINNRPKKCLNFFSPKDVFFSSVALAT